MSAPLPPALAVLLPGLLLLGCSSRPVDAADRSDPSAPRWPDAAGDIADARLAALASDLWEEMLRANPVFASNHGDERYLGRLEDVTPAGVADRRARLAALQQRATAIDATSLSVADKVSLGLLGDELQRALILAGSGMETWLVDPRGAPHVGFFNLVIDQPSATPAQRAAMEQRWAAMAGVVDATCDQLEIGLRAGRVGTHAAIAETVAQVDRILAQPCAEWPLGSPSLDASLTTAERDALLARLRATLETGLRPALVRYRALLADRLLPAARSDDRPGLVSLPGGRELYDRLTWVHTGLPLDAQEVHEIGLQEVASIRAQIAELGGRVFGTSDVAEIQRRLREDPALHFATRDEVEAAAADALARARAAIPRWFGRLPKADCVVVRIGAHEEQETTIAYYNEPAADGSHPGRYFINTWAPETRPRYEAQVLAFHESIPGHHLQIAIAQELTGLPRFRREGGTTAYVEGWALYTERLCDEMGLYSGDVDRLGLLSFDAWRACRLVVDTGLHAQGWSRQQAIDYLLANTLLAPNNVENEVDRYITTPGQALAYKIGQREIAALRAQAQEALGPRFDVRAFHDVVLGEGAVTLPVLRANVEAWIASAR
jgi:uncharacterized protein (DUF885 family)